MDTTKRSVRALTLLLGVFLMLGLSVGTAHAQDPYVTDVGQNDGGVASGGGEVKDSSVTRVVGTSSGATLPFTGGESVLLALVGGGLIVIGGAAVVAGRRRTIA